MKQITLKQKLFGMGLTLCLVGSSLIWLGDGSDALLRKGLAVSGVVLCVGGIGFLRYLLFADKKLSPPQSL